MKLLLSFLLLFSHNLQAEEFFFTSIAFGYKFNEPDTFEYQGQEVNASYGHWLSTEFELGWSSKIYQSGRRKAYISIYYHHSSQLLSGKPFNDEPEYYKDEISTKVEYRF